MTEAIRSARGRLLRRSRRLRKCEWPQLALELGSVEARASAGPVAGGKFEVALARPVGQDAEEIAQIRLGVEAVKPADATSVSRLPAACP
jgi:hypothetical protein